MVFQGQIQARTPGTEAQERIQVGGGGGGTPKFHKVLKRAGVDPGGGGGGSSWGFASLCMKIQVVKPRGTYIICTCLLILSICIALLGKLKKKQSYSQSNQYHGG